VKISCSGDIQSMDVRRRLTYSPEIDNEMPLILKEMSGSGPTEETALFISCN